MAKKNNSQWIQGAIKRPGALTKKAKAAGKSIAEYCSQDNLDARTQRQCNLWRTLRKLAKRRK